MSLGSPPRADELEVSLFGPGVGECVVVHLGNGEWLIVDSCIDPATKAPVALQYLAELGVSPATSVRYVLASHWHDDHTRGIAAVFEAARSARFLCSTALRRHEFVELVAMASSLNLKDEALSGVDELNRILHIVRERRTAGRAVDVGPTFVQADTLVHRRPAGPLPACEVFALSPSSSTLTRSFNDIAALLPRVGVTKRAIVNVAPNDTAVVISVSFGSATILLGSDLEAGATPNVGWGAAVATQAFPHGKALIVKVPHHGSENAHHAGMWESILGGPLAIVTPYGTGKKPLPTPVDIARLKQHAEQVFVTAPGPTKASVGDPMVQRTMNEVARSVRTRGNRMGHIRVRVPASAPTPTVELFGAAFAA